MRFRPHMLLAAIVLSSPVLVAAPPAYQLTVQTDRPDALYHVGQKVAFKVALTSAGKPVDAEVVYILDKDGTPPVHQGKCKLAKGTGVIEDTLAEPGFLRCRVIYVDQDKKSVFAMASAGLDPLKIPPELAAPDDFDAFWSSQKARLAQVPCQAKLTPVKSPVEGVECFDAQVACVGPRPVSGYFARPAGSAAKSLPAILTLHGAGVHSANLNWAASTAKEFKALSFEINAHGIANGQPASYYKQLSENELKDYPHAGRDSRETCYFLGMYLRLVRAMDFLASQPEWDGKILIVRGTSQGGGQALAAAGLDPRVTFLSAGVPAMCDHTGRAIGRINGWPKLVPDKDNKPDAKILQVSRYFDCQNFAARTKAQAVVSVGFVDAVCPPTGVYAVYNILPGKKQIYAETLTGHVGMQKFGEMTTAAIQKHIAEMKK